MRVDRIHAVHVEDSIDNRRVVRTRDERMSKDLLWIAGMVLILIGLFVAYGWPRAVLRDTGSSAGRLQREQEKLLDQNRELRLERAALQDLRRIEAIAAVPCVAKQRDQAKVRQSTVAASAVRFNETAVQVGY